MNENTTANQNPPLDENDLNELLDFASTVTGGAAKPHTEVRREPPQTPGADEDVGFESPIEAARPAPAPAARRPAAGEDDGDDPLAFLASTGLQAQREVPNPDKPWMKHHKFVLVRSVDEVNKIIDEALKTGKCSLDLETEGLDSRMVWDAKGKVRSVHQIVGFCISPGDAKTGYYIPVRHKPADDGPDLNLPIEAVEAAITRLCWAAQPVPADSVTDPLSFKEFKTGPQVVIDFWNAKFDQEFLFPITGIDWWHPDSFEDGMLASFVCYTDDRSFSLKDKSMELLRDPDGNPYEMIKLKELFPNGRRISFPALAPDEPGVVKYACSDAVCTRLLGECPEILPRVRKRKDLSGTYRIEKQVIQVVRVMERHRVRVNREKFRELLTVYEGKRDAIRTRIVELAASKGFGGFEPGSPKQLGEFLFGESGMNIIIPNNVDFPNGKPPKNDKSGQYKTDASTLEQAADTLGENAPPVLKWVIEYREHDKMIGTYLQSLVNNPDENNELRFNFKETGAATGRFSAPQGQPDQGFSGVPIHGIPGTSSLREAFVAREGYTMSKCDYAGQELRIAANVSGESVWINEFLQGEGDLHSITARAFFNVDKPTKEQRKMGKIANFALVYGGGPAAIMRATGCDKIEASRRKQAFDKAVPIFAKWIKGQHGRVREKKGVWTAFGRFIAIPDIDHPDQGIRAACERHSTNYPIQGSGADIMKIALILLHKEFYKRGWLKGSGDDSVRMLLTVHDEIVFEIRNDRVPEVVPIIVNIMASPARLPQPPYSPKWSVPLVVEPLLGSSWGGNYNWEHMLVGKKGKLADFKPEEQDQWVQVGDKVYQKIPPWLEGILKPGYETQGLTPEPAPAPAVVTPPQAPPPFVAAVSTPAAPQDAPDAPADTNVGSDGDAPPPTPRPQEPPAQVAVAPQAPAPASGTGVPGATRRVTFRINKLTRDTVKILRIGCMEALDVDAGAILCILDAYGTIVVDPSMGIRVDADILMRFLRDRTLSDGGYSFDD